MKKIRKTILAFVFALMLLAGVFTVNTHTVSAAVKISAANITLIKGQTKTLKVTGTTKKVTWSSSNKSVASVSSSGKVTARKKGSAVITAKAGTVSRVCRVKVETPKISKTSLTLNVGKSYTLKVTGTSQKVTWSSSKPKVAAVSGGKVTAKKLGSAVITAKVGGKRYTCQVSVKKPFSVSAASVSVEIGKTVSVHIYSPVGSGLKYSIANSAILDCDWGKWTSDNRCPLYITGGNIGTTTITVTEKSTGKTLKISVRVYSNRSSFDKPKYAVLMTDKTYASTKWISVKFTNYGKTPLRIYSKDAVSLDAVSSAYNRSLKLANVDEAKNKIVYYSWQEIAPGTSRILRFYSSNATRYNRLTTIYYTFSYQGKLYTGSSNASASTFRAQ